MGCNMSVLSLWEALIRGVGGGRGGASWVKLRVRVQRTIMAINTSETWIFRKI